VASLDAFAHCLIFDATSHKYKASISFPSTDAPDAGYPNIHYYFNIDYEFRCTWDLQMDRKRPK
jgi:hypothetical protein